MVTLSRHLGPPAHLAVTVQQQGIIVQSTARGKTTWMGRGTARDGAQRPWSSHCAPKAYIATFTIIQPTVRVHIMCCLRRPRVYRGVGQPTSWLVATGWVSPRYSRGRGSSRGQLPGRDDVQIYHRHTVPNWWDGATTPVIDPTLNEEGLHWVCD